MPAAIACRLGMLRGVLIGFCIASLFGMPAQSIAIVMTFWVFVFWFLSNSTPARGSASRTGEAAVVSGGAIAVAA